MDVLVRDDPAHSRYEVHDGDRLAGFAAYRLRSDAIAFTHTEIDPELAGRGLARRLAREALDDARRRGLAVLPFCPFVRGIIARDPDAYLDLVRPQDRERFGLPSPPGPGDGMDDGSSRLEGAD